MNMSDVNVDQLHRSTMGIFSSLIEDFNPSLQKLVLLGNSYIKAFQALAVTSEAYFGALAKIGEQALHSMSSQALGDVIIQVAENQRTLTMEMMSVLRWFSVEVVQGMDTSIRLDKDYISGSKMQYQMEVHSQAAALERQRLRGAHQDCSDYVEFLRRSHGAVLQEEERRYRFVAEKHCGLTQSMARLMNTKGVTLQPSADAWVNEVNATRRPEAGRLPNVDYSMGMREEDIRKNREEPVLGRIPSRAPSPVGSVSRSTTGPAGAGTGRAMRARVAHQPGASSPTLLPFSKGEVITVLVQQPRNGWLYGSSDSSSHPGWFPGSYVEALDEPPLTTPSPRSSALRSDPLNQSRGRSQSGAPPPPPPPPADSPHRAPNTQSLKSSSDRKTPKPHGAQPEFFPRGTNPFATIKLKPTATNDRSAPRFNH